MSWPGGVQHEARDLYEVIGALVYLVVLGVDPGRHGGVLAPTSAWDPRVRPALPVGQP